MSKIQNSNGFRHRVLKFKIDDQIQTQPEYQSRYYSQRSNSPYSITGQSFFKKSIHNSNNNNNSSSRGFLKPLSPLSCRNSGMSMPSYDQLTSPINAARQGKSQLITLKEQIKDQKLMSKLLRQQSNNESFSESESSPLSYEKLEKSNQSSYQKEFYLKMLEKIEEKQMLPRQLGFVRQITNKNNHYNNGEDNSNNNTLQLNHYNLGQYNDVLPDCLNNLKNVDKIECNLSNNQLNERKANQLFSSLHVSPKIINFAGNTIGTQGTVGLSKLITNPHCKLREVNLERNQITDYQISNFFTSLTENKSIIKLNLSENALSNASSKMIKDYLIKNETILELYLHWNQFTSIGGENIFQGVIENQSLKVLDLSWNSLGSSNLKQSIGPMIGNILKDENRQIIHLDLSYNNFSLDESLIIARDLKLNKYLLGFHFEGNYGFVDENGYLVIDENSEKEECTHFVPKRKINGILPVAKQIIRNENSTRTEQFHNCCWICQGWNEVSFEWNSKFENNEIEEIKECFLHCDFENYFPRDMMKLDSSHYILKKMCPPGIVKFYFMINGVRIISKKLNQIEDEIYQENNESKELEQIDLNYLEIESELIVSRRTYQPLVSVKPRTVQSLSKKQTQNYQAEKPQFNYQNSIFKEFYILPKEIETQLMQKDLQEIKEMNFAQYFQEHASVVKVFHLIEQFYPQLMALYHYLAIMSQFQGLQVSLQAFTNYLQNLPQFIHPLNSSQKITNFFFIFCFLQYFFFQQCNKHFLWLQKNKQDYQGCRFYTFQ